MIKKKCLRQSAVYTSKFCKKKTQKNNGNCERQEKTRDDKFDFSMMFQYSQNKQSLLFIVFA